MTRAILALAVLASFGAPAVSWAQSGTASVAPSRPHRGPILRAPADEVDEPDERPGGSDARRGSNGAPPPGDTSGAGDDAAPGDSNPTTETARTADGSDATPDEASTPPVDSTSSPDSSPEATVGPARSAGANAPEPSTGANAPEGSPGANAPEDSPGANAPEGSPGAPTTALGARSPRDAGVVVWAGPPLAADEFVGPVAPRDAGVRRSKRKRQAPRDGGVRDAGPAPELAPLVGPPAPPERPTKKLRSGDDESLRELVARIVKTQWSLLQVLLLAFLVFRVAAWLVRRGARGDSQLAAMLSRLWVFVEGAGWAVIAIWIFTRLSQTDSTVTAGLAGVVVLAVIALSWRSIKDVLAGLVLSAERPFSVGDYVQLGEARGQVRSFRTRVLELETEEGHVIRVPYGAVEGATNVRRGGRRTAHAVTLTLDLPDNLDATKALEIARELAASSPWAVLGVSPKLSLDVTGAGPVVLMEAYAFDRDAGPLLHADLLSGWKEASKRGGAG